MALSVSGFPEPLRQMSASAEPSDMEPSLLGNNNARLRGLFGSSSSSKKPESKPSTPTSSSRQNTEDSIPASTPRSSQMLPPPNDQQLFLAMHMPQPLPPIPAPPPPPRQRQISLTRRTPPPPVKRQPSLGRLEIGSAPRAHALPKPPTVVVQEWSTMKNTGMEQQPNLGLLPRPLPAVPNPGPIIESSKSAALRLANAGGGASAQHRPPPPPGSKILMSSPARPRAQTTAPPTVTVRYQALVVEPTEASGSSSSSSSSSATPTAANNVRPLPRIPPASASASSPHAPLLLPRHVPRPARVKRPKTSPGSSAGFGSAVRSPFDAVPSSWASRPVDLNPSQPVASGSGTHHHNTVTQPVMTQPPRVPQPRVPAPRTTRSHSRPRRDHSADARSTPTSPVRRPSSRAPTSPTSSPPSSRRGSAWVVTNSSSYTVQQQLQLQMHRSTSPRGSRRGSGAALCMPPSKIEEESASIRTIDSGGSIKDGIHSHPMGRLSNDEQLHPNTATTTTTTTTTAPTPETEVFIDDEDYSVLSRSPSPMRYARPSSRGSLYSTTSSSTTSSTTAFPSPRSRSRSRSRRQPRAYRNSYSRGPGRAPSRSPSPILYARRNSLGGGEDGVGDGVDGVDWDGVGDGGEEEGEARKRHRHTQPRSYQFDYKAAQDSSPFITSSSSAASAASSVVIAGTVVERPSRSRSPRRSRFGVGATPDGNSVIDISVSSAWSSEDRSSREDLGAGGKGKGKVGKGKGKGKAARSVSFLHFVFFGLSDFSCGGGGPFVLCSFAFLCFFISDRMLIFRVGLGRLRTSSTPTAVRGTDINTSTTTTTAFTNTTSNTTDTNTNHNHHNRTPNPNRNSTRVIGVWRDLAPRRKGSVVGVDEYELLSQQQQQYYPPQPQYRPPQPQQYHPPQPHCHPPQQQKEWQVSNNNNSNNNNNMQMGQPAMWREDRRNVDVDKVDKVDVGRGGAGVGVGVGVTRLRVRSMRVRS